MEVNYERYYRVIAKKIMKAIAAGARTGEEKGYTFGRTKRLDIEVTFEDILEHIIRINGKCERTGIPFPLVSKDEHYSMKFARQLGFNPLISPSCDRIDPNKGYVLGNIQIVIQFYNIGKGAKSQTETNELMAFLNTPPKEHTIYETIKETKTNNINLKQSNMKTATAEIELIKTLIDNEASEYALKFYIQTQFNNKVEAKVGDVKTNSLEKLYGKAYVQRREYIENSSTEINKFEANHINLKELFGLKDNHAVFANSKSDKLIQNNINIVRVRILRGWGYAVSKEDVIKYNL